MCNPPPPPNKQITMIVHIINSREMKTNVYWEIYQQGCLYLPTTSPGLWAFKQAHTSAWSLPTQLFGRPFPLGDKQRKQPRPIAPRVNTAKPASQYVPVHMPYTHKFMAGTKHQACAYFIMWCSHPCDSYKWWSPEQSSMHTIMTLSSQHISFVDSAWKEKT